MFLATTLSFGICWPAPGGIDCVMLVIAADEGVKAQTEEHLAICSLLGIQRGVVVLTKADAVSPEALAETRARVRRFLEGTFLDGAPMVAVSAVRGDGISLQLKAALAKMVKQVPARNSECTTAASAGSRVFDSRLWHCCHRHIARGRTSCGTGVGAASGRKAVARALPCRCTAKMQMWRRRRAASH